MSNQQNDELIEDFIDWELEEDYPNGERETERAEFIRDMLREDGCVIVTHGQTA